MSQPATHPSPEALEAFALGKLGSSQNALLEEHLTGCDRCQEQAEAVAPDTLVQLLASAHTLADADHAAAPTPTLDLSSTPSLMASTPAWDGAQPATDA